MDRWVAHELAGMVVSTIPENQATLDMVDELMLVVEGRAEAPWE